MSVHYRSIYRSGPMYVQWVATSSHAEVRRAVAWPKTGCLRTRNRRIGDGSRPRAAERFQVYPRETRGGEPDAVPEQHRQDIHQDLVHEPPTQALTGHVSTEDFEVPPARSVQCRSDRFPDITGKERNLRVRRLRRLVGQDEHSSGRVAYVARILGRHPAAYARRSAYQMGMAPVAESATSGYSSGATESNSHPSRPSETSTVSRRASSTLMTILIAHLAYRQPPNSIATATSPSSVAGLSPRSAVMTLRPP